MGPMGVNENHGPARAKVSQENASHRLPEGLHDERANMRQAGRELSHQSRNRHREDEKEEEDELDEDEDMEAKDDRREDENDEDNIDELMDEDELDEGDGSGSMQSRPYYSRADHQGQLPLQSLSQHLPHGSRSLPSILPRPGTEQGLGYGQDSMGVDDQKHTSMSSWDATSDVPRQGGPRNNRPLQIRRVENDGASGGEYSTSSHPLTHRGSDASNGADLPDGSPGDSAGFSNAVSVNNGSSKKRTTPAKHKCPQCDKYFTRPFNLKSHQRTHTQERPFVCSFAHCARAFSRLHDCNRHMRTHWRIKPYSCPECHRNFVRQDALTRHLRLDFGHNRCSGYPGPLPGGASNQDKSDDSGEDPMEDSPTDTPSLHLFSGSAPAEGANTATQAGPPYTSSSSPISPTAASPTGQGQGQGKVLSGPRTETKLEPETDQHSAPALPATPTSATAPLPGSGSIPIHHTRDGRVAQKAASVASDPSHQAVLECKEDREQAPRRDSGSQLRYTGSAAPMSFVHRSTPTERRVITPPNSKEAPAFLSQHGRSFSHSSFSHGQPSTSTASAPLSAPVPSMSPSSISMPNQERRAPGSQGRSVSQWPGPGQEPGNSQVEYYHGPPHPRPPSSGQGATHADVPDFERVRSFPHPSSEYPPSPSEVRRASPPGHPSDWHGAGQEGSRSWGWDQRQQPEARHRHPTWSSAPSSRGAPAPQQPGDQPPHPHSMPPPPRSSTIDTWPRGGPPREEAPPRDPRPSVRMPLHSPSEYPSSPYPLEPNADNLPPRPLPPQSMGRQVDPYRRPEMERDPRQRSMTDIDRARGPGMGWSEQRSRSFHDVDSGADPRSRFEPHPHSPQHAREHPPMNRPIALEASSSGPDRSHIYSGGMVGAERQAHPSAYQEREHFRENGANSGKTVVVKDTMMREYRPTRSHSTLEYDADRDAYHRQQRYAADPKLVGREVRRSMSPGISQRFAGPEGRPYDTSPRYPYPGDRVEHYSREEAERMSLGRSLRHEERMALSPMSREDPSGGYFGPGEPGRPSSYRIPGHNYPQAPSPHSHPHQRPHELPHLRHSDAHHEPVRRERHSIDMPLASPTSSVGGPPPASKRSLSAATITSR